MKKFIDFRGFVSLLIAFSFIFAFISGVIYISHLKAELHTGLTGSFWA